MLDTLIPAGQSQRPGERRRGANRSFVDTQRCRWGSEVSGRRHGNQQALWDTEEGKRERSSGKPCLAELVGYIQQSLKGDVRRALSPGVQNRELS